MVGAFAATDIYTSMRKDSSQEEEISNKEDIISSITNNINTSSISDASITEFSSDDNNSNNASPEDRQISFNTTDPVMQEIYQHTLALYDINSKRAQEENNRKTRDYTTSMKQRSSWTLSDSEDSATISMNTSRFTPDYIEVNKTLYNLVDRYFNKSNFADTPYASYIDPLYVMAISNVEFGFTTTPNKLLAPAVPTNKGIQVTKENILTYGFKDYLEKPNILATDRDGYRGPLQMYVTGLSTGIVQSDLVGSEYTRLLEAEDSTGKRAEMANLQYVEGSGRATSVDGMYLRNSSGNYGDRFNYADSVNRLSQNIKDNWKFYYDSSSKISKSGEYSIDNKYSFMSVSAIGHNSTPGIFYVADVNNLGSQYYWWPFGCFGDSRKYAHYLGSEECINYIKSIVKDNLNSGKNLDDVFSIDRIKGYNIAKELVNKGYIPSGLWTVNSWNNQEKIAYPIQVLYNYFMLQGIYFGI